MRKRLHGILFWCLLATAAFAQGEGLSNLRSKTITVTGTRQTVDSLTIIPSSVTIFQNGARLDTSFYTINNADIIWRKPVDSVLVLRYRVLPYNLGKPLVRIDTTQLQRSADGERIIAYNPFRDREEATLDFRGLDYNGSFARGISFGNSQDLVLNSTFNLQLAGEIGDGIEILAAITDANIPIQPEGNTRQLQEFDRIFIQLKKNNTQLIAGDYDLTRPDSYFMNYFKRLQGATVKHSNPLGKGTLSTNGSVAISRGQFARNQIQQQEGNQGPYRLVGNQGELFIIILSGTEKVWLDGQLMQRGIEDDYIIDYNTGEITFTNKRLITKDSRIIIEFEYSDLNYLRSFYAANVEYKQDRLRLYGNLFNQSDSRTSTGGQSLSDAQKQALAMAGDAPALVPGFDTTAFAPTRVLYKLKEIISPCGAVDTILVYSTNPDSARYTARFSVVGANRGNYVLDNTQIANERVFRYVAPDPLTCQPRGDHESVNRLLPPQQQQLMTIGSEYQLGKNGALHTELALSRNDLNRFSRLDSDDDLGMAAYTGFRQNFRIDSTWSIATDFGYEFVQENFQPLNPYRNPEFLRDWSLANVQGVGTVTRATEHLGRGGFILKNRHLGQWQYQFSGFFRDSLYQGNRHFSRLQFQRNGWALDAEGSLLTADAAGELNRFFRPKVHFSKTFQKLNNWKIGAYSERERNERILAESGFLNPSSFYYDLYRVFVESLTSEKFSFGARYQQREDFAPLESDFVKSTVANELNINGNWNVRRTLQWAGNFTYRRLELLNDLLVQDQQRASETFLGRTDVNFTFWKGAIRANNTYEIGSGQEPLVDFTYVRVRQGEGTHIWLDSLYNNDGVIQPNEMEVAPFRDLADFVRVSVFTNEYIRANYVNLNSSLLLTPKAIWFDKKGLRAALSKFSTQSTLIINRKTLDDADISPWNPFQLDVADTALVSVNSNIRNILFFNRANPKYDLQIGNARLSSKIVQTQGYEARRNTEQFFRSRLNFAKSLSAQFNLVRSERLSDSEFFSNRDFRIQSWQIEPQGTWLPSRDFRTIISYKYQADRNTLPSPEMPELSAAAARQHHLNLEMNWNQSTNTNLRLRSSFVQIAFEGVPASPVGFAILNGLQPGQNFLWNVGLDRQLSRNLRLNLSYEGRKTGTARVVHVGRAQVAAVF